MSESQQTPTDAKKPRPSGLWGKKAAQFYAELGDKTVAVKVGTGEVIKGVLLGVDVYDIIIRQTNGLTLLLPKGNIIYVHAG